VLSKESLQQAAARIHNELGLIDILINGPGGISPRRRPVQSGPSSTSRRGHRAGVQLELSRHDSSLQVFVPDMVAKQRGVVINMASMQAFAP